MEICTCYYKTDCIWLYDCMTVCKFDTNDPNVKEKPQSCQALRCGPNSSGGEAGAKDCWEL